MTSGITPITPLKRTRSLSATTTVFIRPAAIALQFENCRASVSTENCSKVYELLSKVRNEPQFQIPNKRIDLFFPDGKQMIDDSELLHNLYPLYDNEGEVLPFIIKTSKAKGSGWSINFKKKADIDEELTDFLNKPIDIESLVGRHQLFPNIPTFGGKPNLLFHDLDQMDTSEAERYLSSITYLAAFLGSSGSGKTRTIFSLLGKTYGIYLTFDNPACKIPGSTDFNYFFERVHEHMVKDDFQPNYDYVEQFMLCIMASRLFLFQHLHRQGHLTPQKWLEIQLSYDFNPLCEIFRQFCNADLKEQLQSLFYYMRSVNASTQKENKPIRLFIDECQVCVDQFKGFFRIAGNSVSLYHAVIRSFRQHSCCVIASGTGLRLQEADSLSRRDIKFVISERYETPEAINETIHNLFGCKLSEVSAKWLLGRKKFLMSFIEYAIERANTTSSFNSRFLEENIQKFIKQATDRKPEALVGSLFIQERSNMVQSEKWSRATETMREAVIQGLLFGTGIKVGTTSDSEIFELAFGLLVKNSDSSLQINITEPLIFRAALTYFSLHSAKLLPGFFLDVFATKMCRATERSSQGFTWERFLIATVMDVCDDDWRKLLPGSTLIRDVDKQDGGLFHSTLRYVTNSDEYSLAKFLEEKPSIFYMPNCMAGPDIVFFLTIKGAQIPVFVQAKLTAKECFEKSMITTDPSKFFHVNRGNSKCHIIETRKKEFKAISKYLKGSHTIGMVIAYPKSFQPALHVTQSKTRTEILFDSRNIQSLVRDNYLELIQELTINTV
jgi:hypothetical protein